MSKRNSAFKILHVWSNKVSTLISNIRINLHLPQLKIWRNKENLTDLVYVFGEPAPAAYKASVDVPSAVVAIPLAWPSSNSCFNQWIRFCLLRITQSHDVTKTSKIRSNFYPFEASLVEAYWWLRVHFGIVETTPLQRFMLAFDGSFCYWSMLSPHYRSAAPTPVLLVDAIPTWLQVAAKYIETPTMQSQTNEIYKKEARQ